MASGKASAAVTWWTRLKMQGYKFVHLWLRVGASKVLVMGLLEEGGEWRESEKEGGGEEEGGMQLNCCGCTASQLSSQAGKVAHPPPIYIVRGYVDLKRKAKPSTWNPDWKRKRVRPKSQILLSPPPLTSSCDKAFVILPTSTILCQNIKLAK